LSNVCVFFPSTLYFITPIVAIFYNYYKKTYTISFIMVFRHLLWPRKYWLYFKRSRIGTRKPTHLSDAVLNLKVQKVVLSRVCRPWHGSSGDDRRASGRWPIDGPATNGRLVREYVGQTGDYRLGGKRESVVAVLHGMHHLEDEFWLSEHLQVMHTLLQNFRHRLLPSGFVQLISQFFFENEYRYLL